MSLEDFVNDGIEGLHGPDDEEQDSVDNFKTIECDRQRQIVVPTENVWNTIVEIVEEEMWLDINEVLEMANSHTFQIIHQASLSAMGYEIQTSHPKKECVVCEETFVFPHDWDFTRIRGEVSCNQHSMRKVLNEVEQVNQLEM